MDLHPPLATSRLSLRPPQKKDAPFFICLYGDAEVMHHIPPTHKPMAPDEAEARLETLMTHWKEHGYGMFVVESAKDKRPLGYCGLRYLKEVDAIELGAILGKEAWGQGIGPEASKLCIDFAKKKMGATEVVALTVPENFRSQAAIKRMGFERCPELDGIYHGSKHLFFLMHL